MRRHSPRPRTLTSGLGYTLIELLIVVALLGLASAMLVPHMVKRDAMACQAAVRLIIADLSFAQSDAWSHQEYRRVQFYDDGSGYCIVRVTESDFSNPFDPDDADYINDPLASGGAASPYKVNFTTDQRFEGVSISEVAIDGNHKFITFDSLGGTVSSPGVPGTGGTITVATDAETYRITIAPFTGKLTVELISP